LRGLGRLLMTALQERQYNSKKNQIPIEYTPYMVYAYKNDAICVVICVRHTSKKGIRNESQQIFHGP